jgi:uncharacterized membrane protein (Fun14 family)
VATILPIRDNKVEIVGLFVHLITGNLNDGIPAEVGLSTPDPVLLYQFALQLDIGLLLPRVIQSHNARVLVEGRTHIVAGMAIPPMTHAESLTRFRCGHGNAGGIVVRLGWAASKAIRIQRVIIKVPEISLGFLNPVIIVNLVAWVPFASLLNFQVWISSRGLIVSNISINTLEP